MVALIRLMPELLLRLRDLEAGDCGGAVMPRPERGDDEEKEGA